MNPFVIGLFVLIAVGVLVGALALRADYQAEADARDPYAKRKGTSEAEKAQQALLNWFRTAAATLSVADRNEVLDAIERRGLWQLFMVLQRLKGEGRLPASWDPMLQELSAWTR